MIIIDDDKICRIDYLTHYFLKETSPFLSLTRLTYNDALILSNNLKTLPGRAFRRFNNAERYIKERIITEEWLRNEFINLGGKPKAKNPYYFVLGESVYLEEAYEGNFSTIKISLDEIDELELSFTYPDSMATRFILYETDEVYFNPEYHGKVFNKKGIYDIINKYGLPEEQWRYDPKRRFDYFIEVQVWNEQYIKEYL